MSKEIAISVNSITKVYKLYKSRKDRLKEFVHPMRRKFHNKFHALKGISFSVHKGEVLGIIGQNGSGKSTTLKILSSVVTPTSGSFKCKGRLTALLELGGGFNSELNGVENVYFLGAIQGYSKKEMTKRLPAILHFADIGEYAYQPVNRYSSGMYMRLAFSININIDPEILIIDEALGVGDMRFQQKCFRKLKEFKEAGKTIVFCTHSTGAVKDLCSRAIWIHKGEIIEDGDTQMVTDKYQAFMSQNSINDGNHKIENGDILTSDNQPDLKLFPDFKHLKWIDVSKYESYGSGGAQIKHATMINALNNQSTNILIGNENVRVALIVQADKKLVNPGLQIILNGQFGAEVFNINNYHYKQKIHLDVGKPSLVIVEFKFPDLGNGNYSISMAICDIENGIMTYLHWVHDALVLTIHNPDVRYKLGTQLVVDKARIFNIY
ncbi:MAG: ABC transporter ATP-binding protein [Bacteroidota bacterium]|nr:ABC transporter ATP-binding protein [Bacteroidota bacterium]